MEWDHDDDSASSSEDESGLSQLKGRAKWLKVNTPKTGKKREKKDREAKPKIAKKEKEWQIAGEKKAPKVTNAQHSSTSRLTPSP
jgi:hypothetical protein